MYRFAPNEIKELAMAWLALAVVFSRAFGGAFLPNFILILPTLGIAFIAHELSHKFMAQRYGFWAQFRISIRGLLFAFFLALFSPIVFAAPGAVVISPISRHGRLASREETGRISLAGPIANFTLVCIFGVMLHLNPASVIAPFGMGINAFLGLFNMLPFGMFDGKKIYSWSQAVWAAAFILGILALYLSWG